MNKFSRILFLLPFLAAFLTFKFCVNKMSEYKATKWGESLNEGDYIIYGVTSIFVFILVFNFIKTGSLSKSIDLTQQKKDCKYCIKRINIDAKKCPHCGGDQ
jgi:hypothetical protein